MPRLAANLSMLFTEVPFLDRFALAAQAGFKAVECQFPYAFPADVVAERLKTHGLRMVMFNLPAGDWDRGERGLACLPGREDEFRTGISRAVAYARALRVDRLNCLAGIAPPSGHRAVRETLVANLTHAARELGAHGMTLLVEPVNPRDVPGFYLTRSRQTLDLIDDVALPNVALQYDVYHMQVTEGDLAYTLSRIVGRVGHIQIADPPARNEPGTGEVNFDFLLDHLDAIGYGGWVGCEFRPRAGTQSGLAWAGKWLRGG